MTILVCERADTLVLVDPDSYQVLKVGYNHCLAADPAQRALSRQGVAQVLQELAGRPAVVLSGQVADVLYLALAGHQYGVGSPGAASTRLAQQARAHIQRWRGVPDWEIAHRVTAAFGPVIRPWLGVTKLVDGRPQSGAAEYELVLRL